MTTINSTTDPSILTEPSTAIVRKYNAPRRLIMIALLLGWLFDWAFYDKSVGLSVLLYAGALVGALTYTGVAEDVRANRRSLWMLFSIAAFAIMAFVRANEFLTFLNVSAVLLLLMLYAYYFSAENILTQSIASYIIVPLKMMTMPWFSGFGVLSEARHVANDENAQPQVPIMPIIRGLLISLPILLIFTGLLISADIVFAQRLEAWFDAPNVSEILLRFILIGWISWLALGALAYSLTRGQSLLSAEQQAKVGIEAQEKPRFFALGFIESSIVLGMVNLLFGLFVSIQFAYLFGGLDNIKLDGFTFAEYARKGFFELVVVAMLVLVMLLVFKSITQTATPKQIRIFKGLNILMIGLVLVMLVSAFRRLSLYEWTYGFSELRLYAHVFIVWLGITLLWFVLTLWRDSERFAIGLFIAALGFVMTLNVINPDAFIVRQNWERFQLMEPFLDEEAATNTDSARVIRGVAVETARRNPNLILDVYYLRNLSNDAVPELIKIHNHANSSSQTAIQTDLITRGKWLVSWQAEQPWQAYHWGHNRALRLLSAEFDLAIFE